MLSSTRELLETARRHIYAIGAFNIYNLEGVRAVVSAAEAVQSPAMLQIHPSSLKYGGSPLVSLCLEAARSATVPISVHLDHSTSAEAIRFALEAGMNSIMADGSHLPYAENLSFTREMTQLAHRYGAVVEAEIGRISGTEDGLSVAEKEAKMTDPVQAGEFVRATQVDALAVTIGNVHGEYRSEPRLDFDRLIRIGETVGKDMLLVLHGASGLPAAMISRSIQLGVCKFNVNTEVRQAYMHTLQSDICNARKADLLPCMEQSIAAMQQVVIEKMQLFGSGNKAHLHQTPYAQMLTNTVR
ncbi:MAG: class II fructose-bisphosphate aldolase [Leptolyngbya sp. IPPAS B-1204]|uniref:Class II fructose-bisphosphate aldolase n=1 Tax=Leptolyngbya sp. NK1-12 TaxID=2547451 RepID=A0AA96WB96_9CYAN|nr:class II fructose-bisphosphate aldolase [Leptolyngbya sp. NK1-12]MBF2050869.1 class II fructose-bisphosphate aldolase [Elainella sp. C42_A2020_010]RNJ70948.1 MAG: class II fructose-bisphosphate aldolase [Leptolyngbya sp. IPPAS B-1204]WNZ21874.1 class II fructose-bisphosphate aldolase [Leptolyngbya sp. NK1-12]